MLLVESGLLETGIWKESQRELRHLPMQVELGDYALFLRKAAVEIKFEGKKYLVVPQSALLLLVRDKDNTEEG